MNARELLGPLEQQPDHYLMTDKDETETILRALRLLAAAEANDGTTPETDARVDYEIRAGISLGESAIYDIARTLEMERNGLAARVEELEKDASVSGGVARASAEVKTAAGGSPAPNINEAMLLLAEVEPHLDEWNFPITLQDRVTAACNAYFGEVRPFLDAARGSKP